MIFEHKKAAQNLPFYGVLITFVVLTDISVFWGIPVLRPVLGFALLGFLPGLVFLSLLNLTKLGLAERVVLAVGLSLSFAMLFGLMVNTVYPWFGYSTPLSTNSVVISFSILFLGMGLLNSKVRRGPSVMRLSELLPSRQEKAWLLFPAAFPILSILGMYWVNAHDNSTMVASLLFVIPGYVAFIAMNHKKVPQTTYAPLLLMVSISLLMLLALRSNHLIGVDVHAEYHFFEQTLHNGRWEALHNSALDSCLSVSMVPTIYQAFVDLNPEYLFKLLYVMLFCVSPLSIYVISKKYVSNRLSFLAAIFFMAQPVFLQTAASPRTNSAILFFAITIMVLFHERVPSVQKRVLLIVFLISAVFSHYSTSYIILLLLSLTWLCVQSGSRLVRSLQLRQTRVNVPNMNDVAPATHAIEKVNAIPPRLSVFVSPWLIILLTTMIFFWYGQITGKAFSSGVNFINTTQESLGDFFNTSSRGGGVEAALGSDIAEKGVAYNIEFIASWLTVGLIGAGMLVVVHRYRKGIGFGGLKENSKTLPFSIKAIDFEFIVSSFVCAAILAFSLALPFVFDGYGMARTYFQMMVVLSPFLVIGAMAVAQFVHFKWQNAVALVAIIPYLVSTTGVAYQLTGTSQAITLNNKGPEYDELFVHQQETDSAKWLGNRGVFQATTVINGDRRAATRLMSQGGIAPDFVGGEAFKDPSKRARGYIYLRTMNVVNEQYITLGSNQRVLEMATLDAMFEDKGRIYENGASEVWW